MSVAILVATPHTAFGELIRISLEDNGQYQVRLAQSGKEAKEIASRGIFQLAILDSAISDVAFVPLCKNILDLQKGIRLVVIPPENNANHPSLGGLLPHGYINRPFYLPDMIDTVTRLLSEQEAELNIPVSSSSTVPIWLQDPISLTTYLEQELRSTDALAGIIGIYGTPPDRNDLKVWAGQLSSDSAYELLTIVSRYWNREENTDLMRFIRLSADKKDYLIYATRMKGDYILILAYDTKAPLSQIRPQTKSIAQLISSVPPQKPAQELPPSLEPASPTTEQSPVTAVDVPELSGWFHEELEESPGQPEKQEDSSDEPPVEYKGQEEVGNPVFRDIQSDKPASLQPETQPLDDERFFNRVQSGFAPTDFSEAVPGENEVEIPSLSALLGSFPSPDPEADPVTYVEPQSHWSEWKEQIETKINQPATAPSKNGDIEDTRQAYIDPATGPVQKNETPPPDSQVGTAPVPVAGKSLDAQYVEDLFHTPEPAINPLEDTRPHLVTSLTKIGQLEPVSPAVSQLNYTCVLIPRFPQHYLTGELADRLAQWVHQLCLAYGWRLEGISIRPEYLQWTVQVVPSISPGNLVRIVRQRSSLHIFNQYTNLRDQNPSGDFWASGYLIVSGAQPPSAQLLREYISQTRKRQGVIK